MFEAYMRTQSLKARGVLIIYATLIPVPKELNTREENIKIKVVSLP